MESDLVIKKQNCRNTTNTKHCSKLVSVYVCMHASIIQSWFQPVYTCRHCSKLVSAYVCNVCKYCSKLVSGYTCNVYKHCSKLVSTCLYACRYYSKLVSAYVCNICRHCSELVSVCMHASITQSWFQPMYVMYASIAQSLFLVYVCMHISITQTLFHSMSVCMQALQSWFPPMYVTMQALLKVGFHLFLCMQALFQVGFHLCLCMQTLLQVGFHLCLCMQALLQVGFCPYLHANITPSWFPPMSLLASITPSWFLFIYACKHYSKWSPKSLVHAITMIYVVQERDHERLCRVLEPQRWEIKIYHTNHTAHRQIINVIFIYDPPHFVVKSPLQHT